MTFYLSVAFLTFLIYAAMLISIAWTEYRDAWPPILMLWAMFAVIMVIWTGELLYLRVTA